MANVYATKQVYLTDDEMEMVKDAVNYRLVVEKENYGEDDDGGPWLELARVLDCSTEVHWNKEQRLP